MPSLALFGIGIWFARPNNEFAQKIANKIPIKDIGARYTANYIGNWISMSWLLYIMILAYRISPLIFVSLIIITIYALFKHISDATGKSLKETYHTFSLSKKNVRENIFVKFTLTFSISLGIGALIFYTLLRIFT